MRATAPSPRWMLGLLLALLLVPLPGRAQGRVLVPHPKSRFWIKGRATTGPFTCVGSRVEGRARLPPSGGALPAPRGASSASADSVQARVVVEVPVRGFDCGNRRMTSDLQETLQAGKHPTIRFELEDASVGAPLAPSSRWRRVEVLGTLTIAGTRRLVRLRAGGRAFGDGYFRVRGCTPIRMTYFGIEPPTKMFGLIQVQNRVEVRFDLLARPKGAQGAVSLDTLALGAPPSCKE